MSTKSNEPKKVKSKVWNHVVNVVLIEGHDLLPKADNTLPDPFVKFRMGTERYKSKVLLFGTSLHTIQVNKYVDASYLLISITEIDTIKSYICAFASIAPQDDSSSISKGVRRGVQGGAHAIGKIMKL